MVPIWVGFFPCACGIVKAAKNFCWTMPFCFISITNAKSQKNGVPPNQLELLVQSTTPGAGTVIPSPCGDLVRALRKNVRTPRINSNPTRDNISLLAVVKKLSSKNIVVSSPLLKNYVEQVITPVVRDFFNRG
mmetsp:Transcript_27668/g.57348  ORF Transcript_27668/g.57348 Transcript_27668/m.57348 type:complete len:133 (+) Transcript_27668:743-1141(+)